MLTAMTNTHLFVVLAVLVTLVKSAERGSLCTTPNQESAKCIPLLDCEVIKTAISTQNQTAMEFAKQSQCGYDTQPLVCCGSSAFLTPLTVLFDIFTRKPPPQKKKKPVNLNIVSGNSLPDRSLCGLERETPRLIGATATAIDEYPWMALIRYQEPNGLDRGFKCGGTLINNRFVLTAAHCILTQPETFQPFSVRLGEWRLSTDIDCVTTVAIEECANPVVDLLIISKTPHPFYSARSGNNDIGLFGLEKNVKYTDFIRPICLPPADLPTPPLGTIMTVSGWGGTENASLSDVKLKIDIPLVSSRQCSEKLSSYTHVSANQICAGGVEGKDACQGDSGGPLMRTYLDDESQWYQEGVVARGRGCGKKNYPAVYTRVTRYVNWIINNININSA